MNLRMPLRDDPEPIGHRFHSFSLKRLTYGLLCLLKPLKHRFSRCHTVRKTRKEAGLRKLVRAFHSGFSRKTVNFRLTKFRYREGRMNTEFLKRDHTRAPDTRFSIRMVCAVTERKITGFFKKCRENRLLAAVTTILGAVMHFGYV